MSDSEFCLICGGWYGLEMLNHLKFQAYKIRYKDESEITEIDKLHLDAYLLLRRRLPRA